MRAAVVILNYNGKHWLEQFLPLLLAHTPNGEKDIAFVVADNGSTDGSLDWLQAHYPQVLCLDLQRNWGFAEGYNRALARIKATYYVLLNSDVAVTENWLVPLLDQMDKHPRVAACQPKIRSHREPHLFEYAGAAGGWIDRWGFPFCRGRVFDTLETDAGQYDDPTEIFWASGACLVVRAKLWHQYGGLDPDFFAHMEEIDWCWRLQNAGYQIFCFPESTVYHVGGGTLQAGSPFKTYLNFRNNLLMLCKNLPRRGLLGRLFVRMSLDGVAGLRFLLQGQWSHFWAVLRSHFYLYAHWRAIRDKRKAIQELAPAKPLSSLRGLYHKSVVWAYFIQKKKTFTTLLPPRVR
ncbi:MAG: glycosyltransferase family 2 protein [Bernardetiaceae bacterium]